jgi:uncharacterized protein with HEPN domain
VKRDYRLFLEDIIVRIEKIERFIDGMEYEAFKKDEKTVSATIREIEVIGEAVKQVPKDVRDRFGDLPWSLMAKMRDKLIHWYFEVDEEIVWKVVVDKLPEIKLRMQEILDQQAL